METGLTVRANVSSGVTTPSGQPAGLRFNEPAIRATAVLRGLPKSQFAPIEQGLRRLDGAAKRRSMSSVHRPQSGDERHAGNCRKSLQPPPPLVRRIASL